MHDVIQFRRQAVNFNCIIQHLLARNTRNDESIRAFSLYKIFSIQDFSTFQILKLVCPKILSAVLYIIRN